MPEVKVKKQKKKVKKITKKKTNKDGKITQKQTVNVNINTKNKSKKTKAKKTKLKNVKLDTVNKSQIPITHNGTLHIERKDQNDEQRLKKVEEKLTDGIREIKLIANHQPQPLRIQNQQPQQPQPHINNNSVRIRRLPDFHSKSTAIKKLGVGKKKFDELVNSKKIQQKKTPSGQIKFNFNDYIHKNKHDSVYLNEKMEKLTEIIDKPKMTVKEAFDELKKHKEGFEKLTTETPIKKVKLPKYVNAKIDTIIKDSNKKTKKVHDKLMNAFSNVSKKTPMKKSDFYLKQSETEDDDLNVLQTRKSKSTKKKTNDKTFETPKKETKNEPETKKKRGRPTGTKNKPKTSQMEKIQSNTYSQDDNMYPNNDNIEEQENPIFTGFNQPVEQLADPNDYSLNLENLNDSSMNIGLMNTSGGSLIDNNQNDDQFFADS
jgi:hypothetical protein